MRIVIIGRPNSFKQVRERDLPADHILDYSFLQYVDLSGLDLTDYSMRDVDLFNYKAVGTKFPACEYSQFRFPVDNTDMILDEMSSSYNHDFVAHVYKTGPNSRHPIIIEAHRYLVTGDIDPLVLPPDIPSLFGYKVSWRDAIQNLINKGNTLRECVVAGTAAVIDYPMMLRRMDAHDDINKAGQQRQANFDYEHVKVDLGGERVLDIRGGIPDGVLDRWQLARDMEERVKTQENVSRVMCYVTQTVPEVILYLRGDDFFDGYDWQREKGL